MNPTRTSGSRSTETVNTPALNLLDARLKTAEAHAHQAGHKWLRDLCRSKRREALEQATEPAPDHIRPAYYEKKEHQ